MTFEQILMIALPIETDVKTFTDWLLTYHERIPLNVAFDDETTEGLFVESYFQQLPGGHSGLQLFRIFIEIKILRQSGVMTLIDDKWNLGIEDLSQGKVPFGSVRVERVNNTSINAFFWDDVLGGTSIGGFERIFNAISEDFFLNRPTENMIDENIQPGKPETTLPDSESEISQQPLTASEIDNLLSNKKLMKKFYRDYSPQTAKIIYRKIPIAWDEHDEGRWGPGAISKKCHRNPTTVSRYLRAFWYAGLKEFDMGYEIIPNPYKPRSKID
jgi:hypothetical protein